MGKRSENSQSETYQRSKKKKSLEVINARTVPITDQRNQGKETKGVVALGFQPRGEGEVKN